MKVISWNLLRLTGAEVEDVAALIERQQPDLLLMQEATKDLEILTALAGGYIYRSPLPTRIHGLAVWSARLLEPPRELSLPISPLPGRLPPRIAQIVRFEGISFANVHLSHGQFLNRRQLNHIARVLDSPAAMVGDFNAVGPVYLPGFRDVGPRGPTHRASNVLPVRLDRCLVRGLGCVGTQVLDRGPSDHCPIVVHLDPACTEESLAATSRRQRPMARRIERIVERRQEKRLNRRAKSDPVS